MCVCVRVCACVGKCVRACVYMCTCMCVYAVCVYVRACVCACMCVRACVCMQCVCMCVCMRKCAQRNYRHRLSVTSATDYDNSESPEIRLVQKATHFGKLVEVRSGDKLEGG